MTGQKMLGRALILGVLLIPMIGSGSSPAGAADFDKDGYSDLAIGVEWEEVGGHYRAGAVNILYGTANGISAADDQIWTQDDLATPDESENIDYFGQVLAAGDFNGDGAADLLELLEQPGRIDNHAAAHITDHPVMDNTGWQKVQNELALIVYHRMTGIGAAAEPGHDIGLARKTVNDLALALIPPLGSHDDDIRVR